MFIKKMKITWTVKYGSFVPYFKDKTGDVVWRNDEHSLILGQ